MSSHRPSLSNGSWLRASHPNLSAAIRSVFGLLTGAVVILAVVRNIQPQTIAAPHWVFPLVFGVCLAGLLGVEHWRGHGGVGQASNRGARIRQSSRVVYFWLYALFGANAFVAYLGDLPIEYASSRMGGFLVAGIIVLALIRIPERAAEAMWRVVIPSRKPGLSTVVLR